MAEEEERTTLSPLPVCVSTLGGTQTDTLTGREGILDSSTLGVAIDCLWCISDSFLGEEQGDPRFSSIC